MSAGTSAAPEFLRAEWRDLAMLNYPVDPAVLRARVPAGCELDTWRGTTYVSVVGFRFLHTRVMGVPVPLHRNFEEVNLRFYVRHLAEGEWRRGVVFIKELVPRRAIAWVARWRYGENYVALPMDHTLRGGDVNAPRKVSYRWRRSGIWEGIALDYAGEPVLPDEDSEETFITEHYWGYSSQRNGSSLEYRVEHPRWSVWRATRASLDADVAALYGPEFAEPLAAEPTTAFVADGSPVVVRKGRKLGREDAGSYASR